MSLLGFGCPVGKMSVAARGSAAPQLLGAAGAPFPGSPWGKSALAASQRAACEVCAPSVCRFQGYVPARLQFKVPPSPPRSRKSSTFCWYVPVAQGCQPRRCPCSPCCPVGLLDAVAAPLPRWSITAIGSAFVGTAGRSPSGCCCGSQQQVWTG